MGAQALTGRIEESFVRRLELLSDDGRLLLLVAAAEPVGDPLLLWRAAERLGLGPEAAEAEGLLAIGGRVTFRYPLVRSALYRSATARDRRAVHLALADATDRKTDPDRRACHLAAAAGQPDEDVAAELERSAGRAQARGGWSANCTRQAQVVRDAGALAALPVHLTYLGMAIVWTGDFAGTASLVAEIDSVAAATGSRFPPYTLLRLRGLQGREGEASEVIASAIERFGGQVRARHRGTLPGAAQPRYGRRRTVPGSDRAAAAHPPPPRSRPRASSCARPTRCRRVAPT